MITRADWYGRMKLCVVKMTVCVWHRYGVAVSTPMRIGTSHRLVTEQMFDRIMYGGIVRCCLAIFTTSIHTRIQQMKPFVLFSGVRCMVTSAICTLMCVGTGRFHFLLLDILLNVLKKKFFFISCSKGVLDRLSITLVPVVYCHTCLPMLPSTTSRGNKYTLLSSKTWS